MTQMSYHHTSLTAQENLNFCQQLYVQTGDMENTVIGGIQMYLRQHHWDNFSGEKSF